VGVLHFFLIIYFRIDKMFAYDEVLSEHIYIYSSVLYVRTTLLDIYVDQTNKFSSFFCCKSDKDVRVVVDPCDQN
jgi:hypothetical protein